MTLVLFFVLAQAASPVTITNPTNPTKRVTTTTSGGKELLDVNCPGCSGGGGGSSGGDGGYTIVIQGPGADGGARWAVDAYQSRGADGGTAWGVSIQDPKGQTTMAASVPVAISSDQTAVPVSAASLPLPTGAAQDATLTGGTQKAIVRGGVKGATAAADVTSTANGADHQGIDVQVQNASIAVTGTVTANAGSNLNTSALALSATQTDRTQKTQLTDGTRDGTVKAASTAALATDTSVVVALSPNSPIPAGSAVIGHVIADTGSTTAVTGNVTVVQPTGTNLHAVLDTTSTTAVTQATAANLNAQVQGAGASGAAKAGNPVQVGGVFNTTQPTVTSGQGVEAQATARGALIVASGADTFNAAVTGTVTANQGGAPWSMVGNKTNNNAAPGATNVGSLGAVANAAAPTWTEGNLVASSVDLSGRQRTDTSSWIGSTAPTVGQKTMVASIPVTLASNQTALNVTVTGYTATTTVQNTPGTVTKEGLGVNCTAASSTIMAADPNRQGCSICLDIDATANVHLRFSAAASAATTSYLKLSPGQCAGCNWGTRVFDDAVTCISASGTQTVYLFEEE